VIRSVTSRKASFWLLGRVNLFRALLVVFCCACIGPVKAKDTLRKDVRELTLGILASEGVTRALEAWTPMVSLLNRAAKRQNLPYIFRLEPHTDSSLIEQLGSGEIDLFLSDPAVFSIAEVEEGARALLSLAHVWEGITYNQTGALIFTRRDSLIRGFEGMAGSRVMGVTPNELTGWKLALQEARKYRLRPEDVASDLLFSGGNQREVVYAVQNGLVDVGVVRAGVLETLAKEGAIDMYDFRPIVPLEHPGYPFWVSTPLYPDWVMGAMPDVPDHALGLLIDTLLSVQVTSPEAEATGGVVWQAPQNYLAVHNLLISLRARPYENYLQQAATRIYRTYKWPMLALGALIVLSVLFLGFELRRNVRLAEARKNVLQSEVRSKQFYRNAIEDHTVFCMLTKDGVISHVNEHFVSALDRSRGSLVHNPLSEILNETNRETLNTQIMQAMNAGVTWQGALQLVKNDGKAAWVQCTFIPVTGSSDKLSEVAIVASDVTQTRAGASEKRFNNTLELIQDQVVVMRPGRLEVLYVNSAAEKILVTDRVGGNWQGKTVEAFITPADFAALQLRCDALAVGPLRRVTWEVEAKNENTYEISLEYAQPDQDEPRLIAIYRDVSERKVIEKAKNEFIAIVSHELRTPLTSMKGALGLTLSGAVGEMPEKMNGMINMAASNCDRLVVLINDILDLEKIEAGKMDYNMQVFDLNEMLGRALETNKSYAEKFGVVVEWHKDKNESTALTYGDSARLMQVIDNLMSNAAKFSETGAEILVSLNRIDGRWRISIRDFGAGIPDHAQPTIFEKFTQADSSATRSKGGTGLGLSIVKLIVEQHEGQISFVSKEGTGTEFFVDLPTVNGETVIPIPAAAVRIEELEIVLDDTRPKLMVGPGLSGKTAAERLVAQSRSAGLEVEYELGQITARQLADIGSDEKQPLFANWFGATERLFLVEMLEQGLMSDRDVCIVEIQHARDPSSTSTKRLITCIDLLQNWLVECKDLIYGNTLPDLLAITDDRLLKTWMEDRNITVAPETAQVALGSVKKDMIVQFGTINDVATVALYPMAGGTLPTDWPMVLIVSRMAGTQSGQGVVSKFSSGGGGRGRRKAS
jgi:PAS domain S-box-containing protein